MSQRGQELRASLQMQPGSSPTRMRFAGRIQILEALGPGIGPAPLHLFSYRILKSWLDIVIIFWNTLPLPLPEISQCLPGLPAASLLTLGV